MPRILSPAEVAQLGLDEPQGPRVLSPEEVAALGLEQPDEDAGHGSLARGVHFAAKALPMVGGFAGSIPGAAGGAAVGLPTGPGALATGAIGAGIGAGLGAAAGRGLQHVIDTALGYERPISNAADLGAKVSDMAREGASEGAGAALGTAAVGAAAPLVAKGAKALGEAANSLATRTLRGTPTQYRNLGKEGIQDLGDFLLDRGGVRFGDSPANVAERVAQLEESTGKTLGDKIAALDQTAGPAWRPVGLNPDGSINMQFMRGGVDKLEASHHMFMQADAILAEQGPGALPIANKLRAAAQDIAASPGPDKLTFAEAEAWKTRFAKNAKWDKARNAPPEVGAREVASSMKNSVEEEAERAANQSNNPDLLNDFLAAKKDSGFAQKAADMAEGSDGRMMARNMVSPSGTAVGIASGIATAVAGHPKAALPAMASGLAYQFVKNRAVSSLAVTAKGAGSLLQKIVQTNPAQLGRYGAVLAHALQTGGQQSFDARDYVLSQTDPAYQQLKQKLAEQGGQ